MLAEGVVQFLHDEVGVFLELLDFVDRGEERVLVEAEHNLELFLDQDCLQLLA